MVGDPLFLCPYEGLKNFKGGVKMKVKIKVFPRRKEIVIYPGKMPGVIIRYKNTPRGVIVEVPLGALRFIGEIEKYLIQALKKVEGQEEKVELEYETEKDFSYMTLGA